MLSLIDGAASQIGGNGTNGLDLLCGNGEDVRIQNHKVGQVSGLQTAALVLVEAGVGALVGIVVDGGVDVTRRAGKPLRRSNRGG